MFQTVFPSIIRSSILHVQRKAFVRPILLPAARLAGMEHKSDCILLHLVGLLFNVNYDARNHELKKLRIVAYCWLYSANIQRVPKKFIHIMHRWGKAMANYPQDLAQDAVCQSHTGHLTGLWVLPARPLRLNTNEYIDIS